MQVISVALFVLGASVAALALPTQDKSGCPGGYAEGAEIERGRLIYVCQGGQVVPKGCIAEDLSHIPVGGHYDNKYYRRTCLAGSDNTLTFEPTGCIKNGKEFKAGETIEDGSSFFICQANAAGAEPALAPVNQGCVDAGKRVPKKEKVNKDDGIYLCDEDENGNSKLVQAGCAKEGKFLNEGEAFEAGKFWFNCTRIGREKYKVKAAGCVANGKRLNDGDRYVDNGVYYECNIENDKTELRATGCQQKDGGIERKLGCTWTEGTAPLQYEVQCVHDAATNTAKIVQVRCNYNVGGGVYNIEPGCYRQIDKGFAGCSQQGGNLNLQTSDTAPAGLKAC